MQWMDWVDPKASMDVMEKKKILPQLVIKRQPSSL
jgi:hypothetical protein